MKNIIRATLVVFYIMTLTCCLDEIDIEKYVGKPSGKLVVEGRITNEKKEHYIKLTRTNDVIPKAPASPVTGASVFISDDSAIFVLTEKETGSGIYLTDTTVQGDVGKTYTLTVDVDGERFEAKDKMEPAVEFGENDILPVHFKPDKSGGYVSHLFTVMHAVETPSMISIEIVNPRPEDKYTKIWYYIFPGADVDIIFPSPTESLVFVPGTIFRQTKYALSDEHYLFLRALVLESIYKGGVFGSVRANVPTNVSNGGLGFFGACAVKKRMAKMN